MKKAFKKDYGFLSDRRAEKYSIFLKDNLFKLKPKYYAVVDRKRIITSNGVMYALCIKTDIESPEFEPIAECWINGSDIYLWRDRCWGIAVDAKGNEIKKCINKPGLQVQTSLVNKTVLVFQIGIDQIK